MKSKCGIFNQANGSPNSRTAYRPPPVFGSPLMEPFWLLARQLHPLMEPPFTA